LQKAASAGSCLLGESTCLTARENYGLETISQEKIRKKGCITLIMDGNPTTRGGEGLECVDEAEKTSVNERSRSGKAVERDKEDSPPGTNGDGSTKLWGEGK